MTFVLMLCAMQSSAQIFVGEGVDVYFSNVEDTMFSEEKTIHIQSDIAGEGVVMLSKVEKIITKNTPKVANLYIKDSEVSLQGELELTASLALENSQLDAKNGTLILDSKLHLFLDDNSRIIHPQNTIAKASQTPLLSQTWQPVLQQNQSIQWLYQPLGQAGNYADQNQSKNGFANNTNKTKNRHNKQEEPPPRLYLT